MQELRLRIAARGVGDGSAPLLAGPSGYAIDMSRLRKEFKRCACIAFVRLTGRIAGPADVDAVAACISTGRAPGFAGALPRDPVKRQAREEGRRRIRDLLSPVLLKERVS